MLKGYVTVRQVVEDRQRRGIRGQSRQAVHQSLDAVGVEAVTAGGVTFIPLEEAKQKLGYVGVLSSPDTHKSKGEAASVSQAPTDLPLNPIPQT